MKRPIFYETGCGCVHSREQLVKGDQSLSYRLVCPVHREFIKYKYGYCLKCNKEIRYSTPQLKVAKFCTDCNPTYKRKVNLAKRRKAFKKIKASPEELFEIAMQRSDCLFRPLCTEVHIKDTRLPCCGCTDYDKKNSLDDLCYDLDLKMLNQFCNQAIGEENPVKRKLYVVKGLSEWGQIFTKRYKDLKKFAK